jgi:hypothetical protein
MDLSTVFLGAIALSTTVMAVLQVAVLVRGVKLAQRVDRLVNQVEHDIKPALQRVNAVSDDVKRATELAVAQVERADRLFADVADRVDRITLLAQDAVVEPVRQGMAVLQGLLAAVDALRGRESPSRSQTGESEAAAADQRVGSSG